MHIGITQCYLPTDSSDFPAFTPADEPKLVLNLATPTPEGCKAKLTWVVVISQGSLPAKDVHLSPKYVSWLGVERASYEFDVPTTRPPSHPPSLLSLISVRIAAKGCSVAATLCQRRIAFFH